MGKYENKRSPVDALVAEVGIDPASRQVGVAALLFTYRCSIACPHCLFASAASRPDVCMSLPQALRALEMLHELGRVVHIAGGEAMLYRPALRKVIAAASKKGLQSNQGNPESMVRRVPKEKDRYEYDFSIMDKYLDLAEKHMGKPQIVVFNAWDLYMGAKGGPRTGYMNRGTAPPLVTVVDAAGKTQNVRLPNLTDPASVGLWKPLFDQLREQMKKRGLEQTMNLGMVSDFWASKEEITFLKEVTGGLPWVGAGHSTWKSLYDGLAGFGYQSTFFGASFGIGKSLSGWKGRELTALFERVYLDNHSISAWRFLAERGITGNMRGVGRIGADSWAAVKDKTGRRVARVYERYPGGNWGYLNPNCAALAPGPDGPVATMNFEALREGGQECEAVIELEDALTDKAKKERLGEALAKRCEDALNGRRAAMWRSLAQWQSGAKYDFEAISWRERGTVTGYTWFLGSGWQERSERLYALAGEVAGKLNSK
jgi:hypothetical protein